MPPLLREQREKQQTRTANPAPPIETSQENSKETARNKTYPARWTNECTVFLSVGWQAEELPVRGNCYGCFTVHPTVCQKSPIPEGTRRFTLTHLPSGKAILYSDRDKDLRRIAVYLTKVAGAAFAHATVEKIKPLLFDELHDWLRDCYRCGSWLDPKATSAARRIAVAEKRLEARKK